MIQFSSYSRNKVAYMTDFTSTDELFAHFQKESEQIVLKGLVKEGSTELTIQYSPMGCETWIDIEKSSITKATYIGKSRCVKAGEQPHFHPLVKLYIDGSVEQSSHLLSSPLSLPNPRLHGRYPPPKERQACAVMHVFWGAD
jgi:hypothetical protein